MIFVFLLIGTKKYRNIGSEGYINYSKAFVHSILIGIFASIVIGIFNFIFYEIVGPEYLLGHINKLMATLEQTGNIPTEKLDETYQKLLSEAELPAYRQGIKTIIFWIITSGFISLIIGAIVKKTKPLFD